MEQFTIGGEANCLYYVSSKCRSWIPAKSLLVFAPNKQAANEQLLAAFAKDAGWLDAAEKDGAVLILPLAPGGWERESTSRVKVLHRTVWQDALSPDPSEIFKTVWCWETLIFAVGYEEGAVFAGNAAVEQPNTFAQVAMVNGVPDRFEGGALHSDRFLLPDASEQWNYLNKEVPVAVWFLGEEDSKAGEIYFGASATKPDQVKVSRGIFGPDPKTTACIMREFATRIRWKNSPDGTPARLKPERQILSEGEYIRGCVEWRGFSYPYFTRLPSGVPDVRGFPVVVCLHGHGEPAWLFAQKNGWPELQDEEKCFVFVSPDSPFNSWEVYRDEGMLAEMIAQLQARFGVDSSRIYLTGFSNGAMATCWYGLRHPQLYAALAPWNSPVRGYEDACIERGWEMPIFAINGDLDHKMDLPRKWYFRIFKKFIQLGRGILKPGPSTPWGWEPDEIWTHENHYTQEAGYSEGDRLMTFVYNNTEHLPEFCYTEVKDMPHGAIAEEARATWEFVKHFSRLNGEKRVTYIP